MDRRRFLLTSLAGGLAAPLAIEAQQAGKVFRLGFLSGLPNHPLIPLLVAALNGRGWVEGGDFVLDSRNSDQDPKRAAGLAEALLRQGVDVIVTVNTAHALAARQATTTVPIVMFTSGFPVEAGLARSLARPGGNVTGSSIYAGTALFGKYVELLREVAPSMRELGVMWGYAPPAFTEQEVEVSLGELRRGARALNINPRVWMNRTDRDVSDALAAAANAPIGALFVTASVVHAQPANAPRIADFAVRRRLPMLTDFGGAHFEAGGLLLYSADFNDLASRTAYFIERIRQGAKPGDLPIEQPSRFNLVINLKTAKAIGLTIPPSLLARADQIIE
jgi:putative tryptophan/tyrosine transport system substrate-binding protein